MTNRTKRLLSYILSAFIWLAITEGFAFYLYKSYDVELWQAHFLAYGFIGGAIGFGAMIYLALGYSGR